MTHVKAFVVSSLTHTLNNSIASSISQFKTLILHSFFKLLFLIHLFIHSLSHAFIFIYYTTDAREREWDMGQGFAQRIWKGIGDWLWIERRALTSTFPVKKTWSKHFKGRIYVRYAHSEGGKNEHQTPTILKCSFLFFL